MSINNTIPIKSVRIKQATAISMKYAGFMPGDQFNFFFVIIHTMKFPAASGFSIRKSMIKPLYLYIGIND